MTEPAVPLEGLRERKKQQTRIELSRAAYEVVRDHGVAALTADAVAQRAEVSRRTFFNYFPTVESALEPVVEEFLVGIEAVLADVEVDGALMASLARAARVNEDLDLIERITVLGVATLTSENHRGLLHACSQRWLDGFADRLRDRVEGERDDLYMVGAAHALVAAAEASLRVWMQRTGGEVTPANLAVRQQLLADAIDQLGRGFDPEGGTV